ncbi:MAG TPA: TonB-dependent receptor [Candidatus Tumulicola sp.]|nr:TonB-dependent receptor [Candidatus Tumulicola sp.]
MQGIRRSLSALVFASGLLAFAFGPALAGTTGSISGRIYDSASSAPIADAKVSAVSASQSGTAQTNATGNYVFVSLAPDTYVLSVEKPGYTTATQSGVTVLADQTQSISVALVKALTTIGTVVVRATSDLVKPGTTSDVYSINSSAALAATPLGGPGNLNQAYAAMVSVPGVNLPQAQQGWYQTAYIRGGDQDQIGWEFDGIPVNRSYDNAPMTFLSNLGQQELQVYTGGTLATSDASSISGYVNQIVKRGSYPGSNAVTLGIGWPSLYNKGTIEISGATPSNKLSYYVATLATSTGYRYINQTNGAGAAGYFYPLNCCGTNSGIWDGSGGATWSAAPGQSYGFAQTQDRETIANFHWRLGHGNGSQSDDLQLLVLGALLSGTYNSSINDLGGPTAVYATNGGSPIPWQDGFVYTGQLFAPFSAAGVTYYAFPSSQHGVPSASASCYPECTSLPLEIRDSNVNDVNIYKLGWQHNISNNAYFRIFGFGIYSGWYIYGPLSSFLPFGAEISDYENIMHQYGGAAQYANQFNDHNLLTLGAYYSRGRSTRYSNTGGFPPCSADCSSSSGQASFITNLVDSGGNCYDSTGAQNTCFSTANRGRFPGLGAGPMPYAAIGSALAANAQWLTTAAGYHANLNDVKPTFTALSVNDAWKPNDRLTFNIGVRGESYAVQYPDLTVGARAFWFAAYNREFCFGPGLLAPVNRGYTAGVLNPCPPATAPVSLTNPSGGGSFSHTVVQPRFGVTLQANPDNVLRFSAGLYARPASTREASWNTVEPNLPVLLGADFLQYGFSTPEHDVRPDRSTNFDLSWEHHFPGTLKSFKLTPFYRSTQDQLQQLIVNPLTGLFASFNAGHQISSGVEFAFNAGDFDRNGFAAKLAYTYTRSRIQYQNFANGRNVIDNLNTYLQKYNGFTSACAASTSPQCTGNGIASANAAPCFSATTNAPLGACGAGDVVNPYFSQMPQPLFDRNGWYSTYDLIPAPFAGGNGFETPSVASLILNFKHDKWSFAPSLAYSSGAKYGSPLVWPGYDPSACVSGTNATCSAADRSGFGGNILIPDVYTGKFDNFGDFNEPSRITVNAQITLRATDRASYTLTLTNLVDTCHQRGYAWDYPNICVYSTLPSSILPPVGNFAPTASAPAPLRFPYAMWLNNNNTGFVGTTLPFQAAFEARFKI